MTTKKLTNQDRIEKELPTSRWRSKIFSNEWKRLLLQDKHDPYKHQSKQFITALSSIDFPQKKQFDHRTFEKWWCGDIYPGNKKVQIMSMSAQALKHNDQTISQWLDPKAISSPFLRHLRSIDGRNLNIIKKDDLELVKGIKNDIADNCLITVAKVWSIFTDPLYVNQGIFDFRKQCNDLKMQAPNTPNQPHLLDTNHYATGLPFDVVHSHNQSNPLSILSFLLSLGTHLSPMTDKVLTIWTFDLATVCASCLSKSYLFSDPTSSNYLGLEISAQLGFTNRIFWDNYKDPQFAMKKLIATLPNKIDRDNLLNTLIQARKIYFKTFDSYGISKTDAMKKLHLFTEFNNMEFGRKLDGKIILKR